MTSMGKVMATIGVVLAVVNAADPTLVPEVVRGYAGLASSALTLAGGIWGFNTPATAKAAAYRATGMVL